MARSEPENTISRDRLEQIDASIRDCDDEDQFAICVRDLRRIVRTAIAHQQFEERLLTVAGGEEFT